MQGDLKRSYESIDSGPLTRGEIALFAKSREGSHPLVTS